MNANLAIPDANHRNEENQKKKNTKKKTIGNELTIWRNANENEHDHCVDNKSSHRVARSALSQWITKQSRAAVKT